MFDCSSQVYHVFAGRGGSLLLSEEAPGFGSSLLDGEVSGGRYNKHRVHTLHGCVNLFCWDVAEYTVCEASY